MAFTNNRENPKTVRARKSAEARENAHDLATIRRMERSGVRFQPFDKVARRLGLDDLADRYINERVK